MSCQAACVYRASFSLAHWVNPTLYHSPLFLFAFLDSLKLSSPIRAVYVRSGGLPIWRRLEYPYAVQPALRVSPYS